LSNPTTQSSAPDAIETRAADFLQRRRFWNWSEADQQLLDAWLAESLAHRVTYLRLEAGAARIERLVALRPPEPMRRPPRGGGDPFYRKFVFPLFATAASLVLVAILGLAAARYFHAAPEDRSFSTDVGGRAVLKFADGTQMELNTDTAVRYRMTTAERTVWLDRGEVYFRVAHNRAHPFLVIADTHRITDLGTEFLVRSDTHQLEVTLVKGRARLNSTDHSVQPSTLTQGDAAVATSASLTITKKTPQQLADELAWQRGVLVFRNTRLADAIREFNRYSRTPLVIRDPAVAGMRIGGEFRTNNVEDFLRLAELTLKLHVGREGNQIVLTRNIARTSRAAVGKRSQ
jgi:transmembrane sensor